MNHSNNTCMHLACDYAYASQTKPTHLGTCLMVISSCGCICKGSLYTFYIILYTRFCIIYSLYSDIDIYTSNPSVTRFNPSQSPN